MAMNFPWRSMPLILRPARAFAVMCGDPRSTRNCRNSALRIRRPTIAGRSVRTTVSTSGSSGMLFRQVHENIARLNADWIGRDSQRVVEHAGSGAGIELPGVPRTGHQRSFERALSQRAAVMRTDARDRTDLARHIAERKEFVAVDDFKERAFG